MKSTSHAGFWMAMALVLVLLIPVFRPAQAIHLSLEQEYGAVSSVFGPRIGNVILGAADATYDVFAGSEAGKLTAKAMHSEADMKLAEKAFNAPGRLAGEVGNRYISALLMQVYSVSLRVYVVMAWLLLLLPFLGAAFVDGIAQRTIKMSSFGYQNPTAFSLGSHLLILICVAPLAYIVMPWAVSPLFMPAWAVVAAVPMCLAISHMQPVFTR